MGQGAQAGFLLSYAFWGEFVANQAAPFAMLWCVHGHKGRWHRLAQQHLAWGLAFGEGAVVIHFAARIPNILETRQRPAVVFGHKVRLALFAHGGVKGIRILHGFV